MTKASYSHKEIIEKNYSKFQASIISSEKYKSLTAGSIAPYCSVSGEPLKKWKLRKNSNKSRKIRKRFKKNVHSFRKSILNKWIKVIFIPDKKIIRSKLKVKIKSEKK